MWSGQSGILDFMFTESGKLFDKWQMLIYLSAGVIAGILISFVTPRTRADKLDNFFTLKLSSSNRSFDVHLLHA